MNKINIALALFTLSLFSANMSRAQSSPIKDDFDRLDGRGSSGVRVDVIDWAGNLEIHVYPKNSLAGLAMKIDRKQKDKPVMVIGYRFQNNPNDQIIRRALLTMPMSDQFQVFQDKGADGYDKVIVSNHVLADLLAFKLDPDPAHLYPEGHPMREVAQEESNTPKRSPSQSSSQVKAKTKSSSQEKQDHIPRVTYKIKEAGQVPDQQDAPEDSAPKTYDQEEGAIKHFSW